MGKVLMGAATAIWYMAGNWFMLMLANDEIAFTSWGAIGLINAWAIGLVIVVLATRRMCDD